MDMRATDRTLEHGPECFKRVHVSGAVRIFLAAVVNGQVIVSKVFEDLVRGPFIRADCRSSLDALHNWRDETFAARARNNARPDFSIPFEDAHNNGLALGTTACEAFVLTAPSSADIGLINLDVIGKRRIAVDVSHIFTDLVRHAKRGRIGHTQLALQLFSGHAMPRRAEQVHGIKPLLQRNVRAMERCADHGVNMMTAPWARISGRLLDANEPAFFSAFRALKRLAVAKFHDVVEARIIVRELLHEIDDGGVIGHLSLHSMKRMYQ